MERTMSVEEKIRRAEEIYARRQEGNQRRTATVTVNDVNKKDIKLLRKMIIQIVLSLLIYMIIYIIQNNNYIFSEEFLNKANEILSYDMNFAQIYEDLKENVGQKINQLKSNNNEMTDLNETNNNENAIGGMEENIEDNKVTTEEKTNTDTEK